MAANDGQGDYLSRSFRLIVNFPQFECDTRTARKAVAELIQEGLLMRQSNGRPIVNGRWVSRKRADAHLEASESDAERRTREGAAFCSYRDDAGGVADLHALRNTFISNPGGVHPKTAQALARHSTIKLTIIVIRTRCRGVGRCLGRAARSCHTTATGDAGNGNRRGKSLGALLGAFRAQTRSQTVTSRQ
jgi:hypothetical protein